MIYFIFALVIVAADQVVKLYATANLASGGQIGLIDGIIHMTYVKNTGAAFSVLSDKTLLLTIISIVAAIILILAILFLDMNWVGRLSLAAVLGGALGNLIDRVRLSYVVDMFEPEFIDFAVFNVADAFITVGGIVFVIYYIIHIIRAPARKRALAQEEAEYSASVPAEERIEESAPETEQAAEDYVFDGRDSVVREVEQYTKDIPKLDEEMTFTLEDILREVHDDEGNKG